MADITNVFKATIKTMKSRQKKITGTNVPDKSILGKRKQKSDFAYKATDVMNNITKLKEFLLQHRKDYLSAFSPLGIEESKMTDAERDQIDTDAQVFMRTCSDAIKAVIVEAHTDHALPQVKEHREVVCGFIQDYLKVVCKVFSEARAIRVKRVVDKKRLGRLEPESRHFKNKKEQPKSEEMKPENGKNEEGQTAKQEKPPGKKDLELIGDDIDYDPAAVDEDEEITTEEAQMFEQENQQLYEEMNNLVDEVKNIEGKVVEISRLQEIFADKVLEQDRDIDRIADTVVGTTENIKEANEEIREAMKNNAGLRVWILFFLTICSFSLLFLDWYNP